MIRQTFKQLFVETDGLETIELAFLAVFLGLVTIVFLPNSDEAINRTVQQYKVFFLH